MPAPSIDVFLTYDERDADLAREVRAAVIAAGMSCWCEAVDLLPGELWDEVIPARLRTARIMVVLVTGRWPETGEANADWYGPEKVALAIAFAKRSKGEPIIVPVRLRGGTRERVPFGIHRAAAVELGEEDPRRLADELGRVLAARDGQPVAETPATARAVEAQAARARAAGREDDGARADVVVVTALKVELDALIAVSGVEWSAGRDAQGYPYHAADLDGLRIVAGRTGGAGEVGAAERAVRLVDAFEPQVLAICGICAGEPERTALGDVIVATRIFNYEHGKRLADGSLAPSQQTFDLRPQWRIDAEDLAHAPERWLGDLAADRPASLRRLREVALMALHADGTVERFPALDADARRRVWKGLVDAGWVSGRPPNFALTAAGREKAEEIDWDGGPRADAPPRAHLGVMATGSAVRSDAAVWGQLQQLQRDAIAVEMESTAIGAVAHAGKRDFLAIKGVSDHADGDKDDRFHAFASRTAAAFLLAFVRRHVTPRVQVGEARPAPMVGAAPPAVDAITWLGAPTIARLVETYVDHPLDRDLLLSWVPRSLTGNMARKSTPFAQIEADLTALNAAPVVGGDLPLASWLRQAVRLAGPWPHAKVYAAVLADLEAKMKASG